MKEGILHGETLGAEDGRKFGLRTGEDFGSEIGMLKGHCIAWKHLISLDPTFCSDRAIKAIDALEELVNDFPRMVQCIVRIYSFYMITFFILSYRILQKVISKNH